VTFSASEIGILVRLRSEAVKQPRDFELDEAD
jgi:virulence-associated protein VagC